MIVRIEITAAIESQASEALMALAAALSSTAEAHTVRGTLTVEAATVPPTPLAQPRLP